MATKNALPRDRGPWQGASHRRPRSTKPSMKPKPGESLLFSSRAVPIKIVSFRFTPCCRPFPEGLASHESCGGS
eukprot:1236707-Rhodomonas_salina.2